MRSLKSENVIERTMMKVLIFSWIIVTNREYDNQLLFGDAKMWTNVRNLRIFSPTLALMVQKEI